MIVDSIKVSQSDLSAGAQFQPLPAGAHDGDALGQTPHHLVGETDPVHHKVGGALRHLTLQLQPGVELLHHLHQALLLRLGP